MEVNQEAQSVEELASEIANMRLADPELTIKKVHTIFVEQGKDLSLPKVKKAFKKASARLANKQTESSDESAKCLAIPDPNELWKEALHLQATDINAAIDVAAKAFFCYPDTPSAALEQNSQKSKTAREAIFAKMTELCAAYDSDKHATEITHCAFVVAAGVCIRNKDWKNALALANHARECFEQLQPTETSLKTQAAYNMRLAELHYFAACLLMELSFFKDSLAGFDRALTLAPESTKTRQMRCVAAFKATRFNSVVGDAVALKAQSERLGSSKYLVAPFLVSAIVSFMNTKISEGNEWMDEARKFEVKFNYRGPDARIWDMAVETQAIFNLKAGLLNKK